MKTELFSVYDAAAGAYIDPFPAPSVGVAIRGFSEACTNETHQFYKFPEDYSLFLVGEFDSELGVLQGCNAVKVATAGQFRGGPQMLPELNNKSEFEEQA